MSKTGAAFVFFLAASLASVGLARGDAPATQPYVPIKVTVPPGFHIVTAGGRLVLCQPADDGWVNDALGRVTPVTRPTTMPSDIIDSTRQHRGELASGLTQDLALSDPKAVDDLIDNRILSHLENLETIKPKVYYLVAPRATVADLMANGWTDPRFHYNRFAHDVAYRLLVMITTDRSLDELLVWTELHDTDTAAGKREALVERIDDFETAYARNVSILAQNESEKEIQDFIHEQVMQPLKLPATMLWFDHGVCHVYAVKYAALANGMSRDDWMGQLIGRPGQSRPWLSFDLVNAIDPATIRPEYLRGYDSALVLKGSTVVQDWISKGGDGVLAKTLPALRAHPPATPGDLIKTVQDATGVDLKADMLPNYAAATSRPGR